MPIELSGVKETLRTLEIMGRDVEKASKDAVTAGAKVIQKGIKDKAPRGSKSSSSWQAKAGKKYAVEHLADNIVVSETYTEKGEVCVDVGPEKHFFYARMLEYGAGAHDIKITKGLRKGKTIRHPGVSAQPFVEPAFREKQREALDAVADVIREAISDVQR